jgi:hypothetical protein
VSDTKEEGVLRQISVFGRQRARQYISKNMEDWGWYRVSKTNPRKGNPRAGFDVGSYEELVDQAIHGGYRLPGGIYLETTKNTHLTVYDLSRFVNENDLVRVRGFIFRVCRVTDIDITFDRKWLLPPTDLPIGHSEVLYRLPSYPSEHRSLYFYVKYYYQIYSIRNPFYQLYLQLYILYMKRKYKRAIYRANIAQSAKNEENAQDWKDYGVVCIKRAKWKSYELLHNMGDEMFNPVEEKEEEESVHEDLRDNECDDAHILVSRPAGVRWVATQEEAALRKQREDRLTRDQLAAEADRWEECLDPIRNSYYYVNKRTMETMYVPPKSVAAFKEIEEERERAKKYLEETNKRVEELERINKKQTLTFKKRR